MKFNKKLAKVSAVVVVGLAVGCDAPAPATTSNEPQPIEAQQAVAGVGKQGQLIRDHNNVQKILSGPVSAMFKTQQWAELEVKIPHALQLFKATEGRMPKSHEEFMTKIVEFNRIALPELPQGAVYRFNVEKGELWVYPEDEAPE